MPSASMSGMRVEPALPALAVLHRVGRDDALPRPDPAGAAESGLRAAEDLLLDNEALLAVFVLDQSRGPIAEAGLHVIVPQIERLEHMPVGVDDIVGATHSRFLRYLVWAPFNQSRPRPGA